MKIHTYTICKVNGYPGLFVKELFINGEINKFKYVRFE